MLEAESQADPQLVVDTAKTWRVLHVNSAAREIIGDLNEGNLWDMFGAAPGSQVESLMSSF